MEPRIKFNKLVQVAPKSNAEKAGLQKGDSIVSVNKKTIQFFDEFQSIVQANKNRTVDIGILRGNEPLNLRSEVSAEGTIGVVPYNSIALETAKYGFLPSLPVGASKAWGSFTDNAKGIGKVITGQVKANKAFTGPIGIAKMFGAKVDWAWFWSLVGLLSMALALMNLLPIPALDGGHALFLLIEMVKGKPLSDKFMEKAQIVGFCIIVALMVFVLGNDLLKVIAR